MNKYLILYNLESITQKTLLTSYAKEDYYVILEDGSLMCLKKSEDQVDPEIEQAMLKVICSQIKRTLRNRSVTADVSKLMNDNIERLTANRLNSLKFHDRFLDETKALVTRLLLDKDEIQ